MAKQTQSAVVRLIVLLVLFANQALIMFGWNPLPFSEEEIYAGVSALATAAQSVYVWWKNNNVSEEAQEAQEVLERKKAEKKVV